MSNNLLLNKISPPAGAITLLSNVPSAADYASITISCVNTGTTDIRVSIYVTTNTSPSNIDIIENQVLLEPSGVLERSCVIVDSQENIYVKTDVAGAVFRVYGIEKTIQLDPASAASLNNITNTTLPNLTNQIGLLNTKVSALSLNPANVNNGYIILSSSNYFYASLLNDTTFSLAGLPLSGTLKEFYLEITYVSAAVITWWPGLKWAGGTPPVTSTTGTDLFKFYTRNGASTTFGEVVGLGY